MITKNKCIKNVVFNFTLDLINMQCFIYDVDIFLLKNIVNFLLHKDSIGNKKNCTYYLTYKF